MLKLSDLKKLTTAFENSDWNDVHLVSDGVEIHISTNGASTTAALTPPVTSTVSGARPTTAAAAAPATSTANAHDTAAEVGVTASVGTPVIAPTPGIFWAAPSPGAPPFVEVGQSVTSDTTICIVEIMKLMTMVSAGVSGTVVAVVGKNGEPVEQGQSLILIDEGNGG